MRSALLFALLAGCSGSGEAHKAVLVSTGVIEATADSRLLRDLEDGLDEMGFDIVRDPNPLDSMDADTARRRANRVGAAHAIVLAFESSKERDGALPGSHLYTASVTARVVNAIEQHPTTEPFGLEFVREDTSATAIASSARGTWLSALAPHIADALLYSPQLSTVMDGEGTTKALIAVTELKKYEDLIGSRHDANLEYQSYCKEQGERLHSFAKAEGITCYGNPCGQYAMVGVTAENRPIVQDLSRIPIFKVPPARKGYWAEPPERIVVLEEDGRERELMRSGNFYGIATARAGGVGTVEAFTSEGSSAVWGFSTTDGSKQQLTLLAPRERNSLSEVSPDGSTTFWCLSDGGGCFVQGEGAKTPIPQVWWARWTHTASGLRLVAGQKGGGLLVIDPSAPGDAQSITAPGRLREVLGVSGDKVSVLMRDESRTCSLVHVDVAKGKVLDTIEMPMCIESAKMVPDGRIVGTAVVTHPDDVPGDAEVVVWEPGQNVPFQLTTGSFHEEIVYPAHDGSKVFFNRRLEAPPDTRFDTQVYRRAVCEVELPER